MAFEKIEAPPAAFLTEKELRKAIHKYGKRAQSRLRTLEKAYSKGGKLYGRKSYVLDRFGDFNTIVKNKSRKALELQYEKALEILNAKSSTVKGVLEIDKERFDTFQRNHPNIGREGQDEKKKTRYRPQDKVSKIDKKTWETAMHYLGRIQAAERGSKYDSDEQVFVAFKLAEDFESQDDIDKVLNEILAGNLSTSDIFAEFNPEETEDYMPIYDDPVNEKGD